MKHIVHFDNLVLCLCSHVNLRLTDFESTLKGRQTERLANRHSYWGTDRHTGWHTCVQTCRQKLTLVLISFSSQFSWQDTSVVSSYSKLVALLSRVSCFYLKWPKHFLQIVLSFLMVKQKEIQSYRVFLCILLFPHSTLSSAKNTKDFQNL